MTQTNNTREYKDMVSYNMVNTTTDSFPIVTINGTVTRAPKELVSKKGSHFASMTISSAQAVATLKKAFAGMEHVDEVPDTKNAQVQVLAFDRTNRQGEVVAKNVDYLVNKGLQENVWENHQIKQRGDKVTVVGVPMSITSYTAQNGTTYYNFNLRYLLVFKARLSQGFYALNSNYNADRKQWSMFSLVRGNLADAPQLVQPENGKEFISMRVAVPADAYKSLQFATQDRDGKLPEHAEDKAYFINVTVHGNEKDFVMKRNYQKGDDIQVLGLVTGLTTPSDAKYEPQVQMFADDIYTINRKQAADAQAPQAANTTDLPDPFAQAANTTTDNSQDSSNVEDPFGSTEEIDISDEDLPF